MVTFSYFYMSYPSRKIYQVQTASGSRNRAEAMRRSVAVRCLRRFIARSAIEGSETGDGQRVGSPGSSDPTSHVSPWPISVDLSPRSISHHDPQFWPRLRLYCLCSRKIPPPTCRLTTTKATDGWRIPRHQSYKANRLSCCAAATLSGDHNVPRFVFCFRERREEAFFPPADTSRVTLWGARAMSFWRGVVGGCSCNTPATRSWHYVARTKETRIRTRDTRYS